MKRAATRFVILGATVLGSCFAQERPSYTEWANLLQARMQASEDLIALRYRRDAHGAFEVCSADPTVTKFLPLFPAGRLPHAAHALGSLLLSFALFGNGDGVLGSTDAERHLRRIGVDTSVVGLRQFLVGDITTADADLARAEALDRAVAIEFLVQGNHRGAVAELVALRDRKDTPPPLRAHVERALAHFGHGDLDEMRARLAAAELRFPPNPGWCVVVDHTRLPDLTLVRALVRSLAQERSYRFVHKLKSPTAWDLHHDQLAVDLLGEMPFEVVRRLGDVRLDHTMVAGGSSGGTDPTARALVLQAVGAFDLGRVAAALEQEAAAVGTKVTRNGERVAVASADTAAEIGASSLVLRTSVPQMAPNEALAKELLGGDGDAITIVLTPTSDVWASIGLPTPAADAVVHVCFAPQCHLAATIPARDAAAAAEWSKRAKARLLDLEASVRSVPGASGAPPADQKDVLAAIAAVRITVDGAKVEVVADASLATLCGNAVTAVLRTCVRDALR